LDCRRLRYEPAAKSNALDRRVADQIEYEQLLAADLVLRATLPDRAARERASRLIPPPSP
jgi:hypothetical protein